MLIVPLWAVCIACVFAQALFQRAYVTIFDYALIAAICVVAGAVISDFGRALLGFVAAMSLGVLMLVILIMLPISHNPPTTEDVIFQQLWISSILFSTFPFPIIGFLVSTVIGSFIGERFF